MDSPLDTLNAHRSRLFGIAYRMLGSRAQAEDVVQEAYIRWHQSDTAEVRSAEAWLVTSVTWSCIDHLRAAKIEREAYTGPWLPEPVVSPDPPSPEGIMEMASDVSIAFLAVLERLAPEERSAFLLREERIARLYYALGRRFGGRATLRVAEINGAPGLLRYLDGRLDSVLSLVTDGVRILDVYSMRNPDKLKGLAGS